MKALFGTSNLTAENYVIPWKKGHVAQGQRVETNPPLKGFVQPSFAEVATIGSKVLVGRCLRLVSRGSSSCWQSLYNVINAVGSDIETCDEGLQPMDFSNTFGKTSPETTRASGGCEP